MAAQNWFRPQGLKVPSGKIVAKVYFQTAGDALWFKAQKTLLVLVDHYQRKLAAGARVKLYFVGRADKRRYSVKGGNQKLSEERAKTAKDFVDPSFKGNSLYSSDLKGTGARYAGNNLVEDRRVDIYEWYRSPPPIDNTPYQPIPPVDIIKEKTALDPYLGLIRRNHVKSIRGAATSCVAILAWDTDKIWQYASNGIHPRKPSWWNQRNSQIAGYDKAPELVKKALLMHRDLQAYFYWERKADYNGWAASKYKDRKAGQRVRWFGGYEMYAMNSVMELYKEILKKTQ